MIGEEKQLNEDYLQYAIERLNELLLKKEGIIEIVGFDVWEEAVKDLKEEIEFRKTEWMNLQEWRKR